MSNQPLISIDVVPLRLNRQTRQVEAVLARREFAPSAGRLALPGVLLLSGELLDDAVHRALRDKAGIMREHTRAVGDVGVFDTPGRDPRGPTLSITKYCIVGDRFEPRDGVEIVPLTGAKNLPFDHDSIIRNAARVVRERLWLDLAMTEALVGCTFTTRDAADAQDSLASASGGDHPLADRTNLARNLKRHPWIQPAETLPSGEGRPARGWEFI